MTDDEKEEDGNTFFVFSFIVICIFLLGFLSYEQDKCNSKGGVYVVKVGCMDSSFFK